MNRAGVSCSCHDVAASQVTSRGVWKSIVSKQTCWFVWMWSCCVLCCVVFEGWRVRQARLDHRRGVVEALQHEGQERAGREPVRAVQEHNRVRAVWKGVRACVREKRSRFDRYVEKSAAKLGLLAALPSPPLPRSCRMLKQYDRFKGGWIDGSWPATASSACWLSCVEDQVRYVRI